MRDDITDWLRAVYLGQYSFKSLEEAFRSAREMGAAAERDKWEAKFKQLEALMQVREQQPNKPCCLAEREACAALADAERSNTNVLLSYPTQSSAAYNIGIAIRARGEHETT